MRTMVLATAISMVALASQPVLAQQIEHGVTVQRGWLNTRKPVEPMSVVNSNGNQMKGAHRIGITVFNVAFPDEYKLVAKSHGTAFGMMRSDKSSMQTRLVGVDLAARQKITDEIYADFVTQLKAAGYEVVDQQALVAAAPELAAWTSEPNGFHGRFGAYLAPKGMSVRRMPGDTANRSTSGMLGQQMLAFRTLDRTQAYQRSPYVARDAQVTALAVNIVVDYGVYSTSGNRKGFGRKVSTGFEEGATISAGTSLDTATVVRVWNSKSGGFPTQLTLQQPVISDADIGPAEGSDGDYTIRSSDAAFVPAAIDVGERANGAIVTALLAGQ